MEWFRHDSNANLDEKLQHVLLDYGLEGYGLYWYCIELIVGRISQNNLTFELKHDAQIIAKNTGSTPQKVEQMMHRFVELGLFEDNQGTITCMKVAKRLISAATSNPSIRNLIAEINKNSNLHQKCLKSHDTVTAHTNIQTNNTIKQDEFNKFWEVYPKKLNKSDAIKAWKSVNVDLQTILDALQWQKDLPDWKKESGQFVPYPASYLRGRRWEDEKPQPIKRGLVF